MKLALLFILMILAIVNAQAGEEVEKKSAYTFEQIRIEEAKLTSIIRGPVNSLLHLYEKNSELWYMDPLVRDRWMKNVEGLIIDGFYNARKARILMEGLNILAKDSDRLKNLERATEYLNQLRFINQGILKNIATMKVPLAPRVSRALGLCHSEEVSDPNGLFLNLDQAEDRLQKLLEIRVNLIEHLLLVTPELFKSCPTASDILDKCADLYLDPKVKCFAELKELTIRTDLAYKNRCDAISRVIGFHNLAIESIEEKISQLESAIPLHTKISKLREEAGQK